MRLTKAIWLALLTALLWSAAPVSGAALPVMARLVFDGRTAHRGAAGAPHSRGDPSRRHRGNPAHVASFAFLTSRCAADRARHPRQRGRHTNHKPGNRGRTLCAPPPGTFATPPLRTVVSDRSGLTVNAVAAPVPLTVASVLTDADVRPRDIKPQATLSGFWAMAGWAVAAILALLLVAGVAGWLWQRRSALRNRRARACTR